MSANTDRDHIYILFEAPPQVQLSRLVNSYKTVSARLLRKQFADQLAPYYWKPVFWSQSYFICTVSEKSEAVVKAYIESQGAANPSKTAAAALEGVCAADFNQNWPNSCISDFLKN